MKVRAKFVSENGKEGRVVGYFGNRRIREGQVFEIVPLKDKEGKIISPEQQFSKKWMERLDGARKTVQPKLEETSGEPDGFAGDPTQPGSESIPTAESIAANSGSNSDVI